MNEENNIRKTRLLEDLDNVRSRISELEESEKRHAKEEKELKDSTERFRLVVDSAPLGVFTVDVQGRIKYMNSLLLKKFKLPPIESGPELDAMKFPPFVASGISKEIRQCLEIRKQSSYEHVFKDSESRISWLRHYLNPIFDMDGSINGVLVIVSDITEQKKSENDLKRQLGFEKNMHMVLSRIVGMSDIDEAISVTLSQLGKLSGVNRSFLFLLYDNDAMMDNTHEWCADGIASQMTQLQNLPANKFPWLMKILGKGESVSVKDFAEIPEDAKTEQEFFKKQDVNSFLIVPLNIKEKFAGFIGYAIIKETRKWKDEDILLLKTVSDILGDFLERKRSDDTNRERDERFRLFAHASFEGIAILDKTKIIDANQVLVSMLGYKPSELTGKDLKEFVDEKEKAGLGKYLEGDISQPFIATAKRKDGSVIPVEIHSKVLPFQDESFPVVAVRDVSAQESESEDKEKDEDLGKMRAALFGAVQAFADAVALRDPFAEGHGHGVSNLACEIAKEMKLPGEQIEGLNVAAIIHDIGKICIPVEILSKPGRITEAEFMIIKSHPKVGHDLLKDIKFPWPIAKIVLQHHERMDGSGYPDGISGDDILLEARIITVAEVIDTILSNRSYRPARGVDSAIEEITKYKGKLYDAAVCDAAFKIVKREGFALEHSPKIQPQFPDKL
jgi:PAS domain S-box-containing protein/putative nucleotidyltransferase with HDIG domain